MKILVDKIPNDVSECDWANPTDPFHNLIDSFYDENTIWFCNWMANYHHETCPMAKGGECPYFTDHEQLLHDKIIEELNKIGEVYPISPTELAEVIKREYGNK